MAAFHSEYYPDIIISAIYHITCQIISWFEHLHHTNKSRIQNRW